MAGLPCPYELHEPLCELEPGVAEVDVLVDEGHHVGGLLHGIRLNNMPIFLSSIIGNKIQE